MDNALTASSFAQGSRQARHGDRQVLPKQQSSVAWAGMHGRSHTPPRRPPTCGLSWPPLHSSLSLIASLGRKKQLLFFS